MSDQLVKYVKFDKMIDKENHSLVAWPHSILCKQEFIYAIRPSEIKKENKNKIT